MSVKQKISSINWGIEDIDQLTQGLPLGDVSIIETPNYHSAQIILGEYIYESLKCGETCALLTFDSARVFIQNFLDCEMDFRKYLEEEKLILLNYRATINQELGLSQNFESLFEEVKRLSGGNMPPRIAIQQVDTLINLNSIVLMNQSVQKMAVAANKPITANTTILGSFVQFNDDTHKNLSIAFQKAVPGYFSLSHPFRNDTSTYSFQTKKLPWFQYEHSAKHLKIDSKVGFCLKKNVKTKDSYHSQNLEEENKHSSIDNSQNNNQKEKPEKNKDAA